MLMANKQKMLALLIGVSALLIAATYTHAWFVHDAGGEQLEIQATTLDVDFQFAMPKISGVTPGDADVLPATWGIENKGTRNVVLRLDLGGSTGIYGRDNPAYAIQKGDAIPQERMDIIIESILLDIAGGSQYMVDACFASPYDNEPGIYYLRLLSGGHANNLPIRVAFSQYLGGNAILEDGTRDRNRPEEQGAVFTFAVSCLALQNTREAVLELWGAGVLAKFDQAGTTWN